MPVTAYFLLQTKFIQTIIIDKIVSSISADLNTEISIKSVDIGWHKLILSDVLLKDQKKDTLFYAKDVSCFVEKWNDKNDNLILKSIQTSVVKANINRLAGSDQFNYDFLVKAMSDTIPVQANSDTISQPINLICKDFIFKDSEITFIDKHAQSPLDIKLKGVNLHINDISLNKDSIKFNLKDFSLKEQRGIEIRRFKGAVTLTENMISIEQLKLATRYSEINLPHLYIDAKKYSKTKLIEDIEMQLKLSRSNVSFSDIAMLMPQLKGMNLSVFLSGQFKGNLDAIRGKRINIGFGQYSKLKGDFYLNGLSHPENAFLNLEVKDFTTASSDIENIHLPKNSKQKHLPLPEALKNAGLISYRGNFTGFNTDFVAYGILKSDVGIITSDLSFKPDSAKNVRFKGHLKTNNFQLGKLLPQSTIGSITLNSNINGIRPANGLAQAVVDGNIESLDLNQYQLKNIELKGDLNERKFDGKIVIDDKNLGLDFSGKIDFTSDVSEFNFITNISHANLAELHFAQPKDSAFLQSSIHANFKAESIDNVWGAISILNTQYTNNNGTLHLKDFQLETQSNKQQRTLNIHSDHVDGKIVGQYSFSELKTSLQHIIASFLPSAKLKEHNNRKPKNAFTYHFDIKNINSITQIIQPNLKIKTPFSISGHIDEWKNDIKLESNIPEITYNGVKAQKVRLSSGNLGDHLRVKIRSQELTYNKELKLYNFSILNEGQNDTIHTHVNWNNWHEKTYSGNLHLSTVFHNDSTSSPIELLIMPSQVYVADSLWTISDSKIQIDNKDIDINNFRITQGLQQIDINGSISTDKTKQLNIKLNDINLKVGDHLIEANSGLAGIVNGEIGVYDFWEKKLLFSDIGIKDFQIEKYPIGDIELISKWDNSSAKILSQLKITEGDSTILNLNGHYDPEVNQFDYHSTVNGVNMNVINLTMDPEALSEIKGRAYGDLRVFGNWPDLKLEGALLGKNSSIKINFSNTHYTFTDTVTFTTDRIIFDQIKISDETGRTGIFDGDISHKYFGDMKYNLNISTDDLWILNTTANENESFYGQGYAKGTVNISGEGSRVKIGGQVTTNKGTEIYIPIDDTGNITENNFVHFKNSKSKQLEEKLKNYQSDGVEINLDLIPTPDAHVQLIMDSYYAGILKGNGNGSLKLQMDRFGQFEMYGDIKVAEGVFKFSLLDVVNKNFVINPGGTIHWNGDPYEADINISGIYRIRASINDLPLQELIGVDPQQEIQRSRIPVECQINLEGMLSSPGIRFGVELPSAEPQVKDAFQLLIGNQEDLNRQILMLLTMRRFYTPPQYQTTTSSGVNNSDLVNNSAGELISNQLTNWLSQISDDWNWGINYRPRSGNITSDEVEIALSTQFFNNRLVVNGNLGNSASTNKNTRTLTGDFDVIFRWTNKLQLKAFSRTNDNLIYDSSPTTQGIGVSYREDFNSWNELFKRYTKWFSKSKKKKSKASDK